MKNKLKEKSIVFKVLIFFVVFTILGFFIIPKLSVRLNPSATFPSINVDYTWANASPYTLEKEVTAILEAGFSTLKGVSSIQSKSFKEGGFITLSFDKYTNIAQSRFEVATIIRQLYKKLPDDVSYPIVSINKPDDDTMTAFLSYSINASQTSFKIQEVVKNYIEPYIGAIQHIDKIEVFGAQPKEFVVNYNMLLLKQLKISKRDIVSVLLQNFEKLSLGEVLYHEQSIGLVIYSSDEINWHIPVKKIGERIIYLDAIARVSELEQEAKSYYRINGKNAINMSVYATKNANIIVLAKKVSEKLKELKSFLPENYSIIQTYNATEYLNDELDKIYKRTGYTVAILLLFVLIVSGSFRYLWISVISLIANISIAFLLYYVFKVEIQLYSLAGITISLGLIIDNSIVMIDHIRHENNKKVFISILASTLTTIGALSIIYFLDDKLKVNLVDFALVIIINLSVSLVVALLLIPALLDKFKIPLKKEKKWNLLLKKSFYRLYKNTIIHLLRYRKLAIIFIILLFGIPFFMLPQKLEKNITWYEKTYNNTFGNEWFIENARPYMDKYLGGVSRLFSYYVFENASYGRNEETKLYVVASMEKGATVHQMNEAFLEIENYLHSFTEIKQYITRVHSGNYARIEITFRDQFATNSFPYVLKSRLIRKALDLAGMDWDIYGVGSGFTSGIGSTAPISFTVKALGYNYDDLNKWADTLKVALKKHPRIQKVIIKENSYRLRKPSFEYRFSLDKEKLALAKSSPSKIFNELKSLTLSKQHDLYLNIQGKYTPIRLESDDSKSFDLWSVKHAPLYSLQKPIILQDIASVTKEREEENIYKENQEYIRLVQFQYMGSAKFGGKYLNQKLEELKQKLPLGYKFETLDKKWFFMSDKDNNYFLLLFLILGIIYFVTAILFESLKQPFIILSVIPISFIGVFLSFYLFDFNFDQGGLASFVLLSGITVNASIYIVNAYNGLKKQHLDSDVISLYMLAFKQKIFPIVLTIFSTIIGFIPFVIGGQNEVFWFALGVGTIGGLLFSLVGILFYLPLFTISLLKKPY